MRDFSEIWLETVNDVLSNGNEISPRDKKTKEILHKTIEVDMKKPVLLAPSRKLSYTFLAAEAFWILSGDDKVETIAPYNKFITEFSDDSEKFFGAYGPKIQSQLPYVIKKLSEDKNTRQAGLTIWRESPPNTKDVPCTVAIFFNIRDNKLNTHVFMRSSDVWLGLPYDVFNFSMLSYMVCGMLHEHKIYLDPGSLFLTAASSHLYEIHWEKARACLSDKIDTDYELRPLLWSSPNFLMQTLEELRDSKPGDLLRWWEQR